MTSSIRSLSKRAAIVAAFAAFALTMPPAGAVDEPHPGSIHIVYEPPKDPRLQHEYQMVKERASLEMLKEFFSPFQLPEDLYFRTTSCDGVPNAYFFREADVPTIRICYEYLRQLNQMIPKEPTAEGITPRDAFAGHQGGGEGST